MSKQEKFKLSKQIQLLILVIVASVIGVSTWGKASKPKNIVGLTAPGMPRFSPGMKAEGLPPKGYDVLTFDKNGNTQVFSQY